MSEELKNLKDEGNKKIREKNFKEAIVIYTKGIEKIEKEESKEANKLIYEQLLNNRAQGYINIEDFSKSIEDLKKVLKINDKNSKAFCRIIRSFFKNEQFKECLKFFHQYYVKCDSKGKGIKNFEDELSKLKKICFEKFLTEIKFEVNDKMKIFDVIVSDNVTIICYTIGFMNNNSYVILNDKSEDVVIIDCPFNLFYALENFLKKRKNVHLLLTHGHFDHLVELQMMQQNVKNLKCYLHKGDEFWLDLSSDESLGVFKQLIPIPMDLKKIINDPFMKEYIKSQFHFTFEKLKVDKFFDGGEKLNLVNNVFEIFHTPGHSEGSVCVHIAAEGILFTGDTLFVGSVGRYDLKGGDLNTMIKSIKDKIFTLSDETVVFPGHPSGKKRLSTVGIEKIHNIVK